MFRLVTKCPVCHTEQITEKALGEGQGVQYILPCGHYISLLAQRKDKLTRRGIEYRLSLIEGALQTGNPLFMDGRYFNAMEILSAKYHLEQSLQNNDYVE